ncbi:hypothetical protein M9Y10_012449 [Tritrichomonas musculus]|uniref:Enhancer of mRNA-decapping protein 4 WD40 repeat region domain-containing protein n=1 Tax=Tritrichomonas musculus TaxID=1915356 RepID=A0ABR2ICL7_9EUKA
MTNAEFYNKIKKQAAHMESSYPELSQHITSQSPSNKKTSQEKNKKLTIQMNPKDEQKKPFLNPSMIVERPQAKSASIISISKERPPSATISSSSIISVKPANNKTQTDSNNSFRIETPNKQTKIKLDPGLIKYRSKSLENGQQLQTVKDNEKKSQPDQKIQFPPGFEKDKNDNKDANFSIPPGFDKDKNDNKGASLNMPPGFDKNESENKDASLNIPPGFDKDKNDNKDASLNMSPGFDKNESKNKDARLNILPGFDKKESENKSASLNLPPGFDKTESENKSASLSMPPGFDKNESENKGASLNMPPGFDKDQDDNKDTSLNMPPGFSNQINDTKDLDSSPNHSGKTFTISLIKNEKNNEKSQSVSKNVNSLRPEQFVIKTTKSSTTSDEKENNKITMEDKVEHNSDISEIKDKDNCIADLKQDKDNQNIDQPEIKEQSINSNELNISFQENKLEGSIEINMGTDDLSNDSYEPKEDTISNQSESLNQIQPNIFNQEGNEQLELIQQLRDNEDSHHEESNPELGHQIQDQNHLDIDKESQKKPKFEINESELQEPKMSDIPEHIREQLDLDFDTSDMSDFRFGYEEEEEEEAEVNAELIEEEEEIERNIILPSQLVAQPLEIEKRTPIITNIKIETIDTINPFASYEDVENQIKEEEENNNSNSNKSQFVSYDSSRFPASYGINENMAYAFKQDGGWINVFDLTTLKFHCFKQDNLTAIAAKDNCIIASGNEEIHSFKIGKKISRLHNRFADFHDVTSLVADPLDHNRFFYFIESEKKLYILLTFNEKNKKRFVADNVFSFDVCSKYLLVLSTNDGLVHCKTRKDGSLFDLWQRPVTINTELNCYITDDYYMEKIGSSVSIFEAQTLKKIQTLSHIVHIFKGGGNPLFLLSNGSLIHFRQVYQFPRPVICAVANKNSVIAWHSLDSAPLASKTKSQAIQQTTFNKHQLKDMHTKITKKTREYLKEFPTKLTQKVELFKAIDSALANSGKSIEKLNVSLNEMIAKVKSMTPKTILESCLEFIENKQYEQGFENSLMLEKIDFNQFLADKRVDLIYRLIRNLNDNNDNDNSEKIYLSDDLLTRLTSQIIDNIEISSIWLVDRLIRLLLALPEEKKKMVLQLKKEKVQTIIQEYSAGIQEENTLKNLEILKQIFSSVD